MVRLAMIRKLACAVLPVVVAGTLQASGGGSIALPQFDMGIGPSAARVYGDGHGYAVNVDLSCSFMIFTASVNTKYLDLGDESLYGPQFEFTLWTGFNWGGGAGYLYGDREGPVYHLFAGVPLGDDSPLGLFSIPGTVYAEPFYRANFFRDEVFHEFGIMLKYNTYVL